jgi:hypothetical protein
MMDEPRCKDGTNDHVFAIEETGETTVLRSVYRCVFCGLERLRYWQDGKETIRYARKGERT